MDEIWQPFSLRLLLHNVALGRILGAVVQRKSAVLWNFVNHDLVSQPTSQCCCGNKPKRVKKQIHYTEFPQEDGRKTE